MQASKLVLLLGKYIVSSWLQGIHHGHDSSTWPALPAGPGGYPGDRDYRLVRLGLSHAGPESLVYYWYIPVPCLLAVNFSRVQVSSPGSEDASASANRRGGLGRSRRPATAGGGRTMAGRGAGR